jgi:hypothetical protein
MSNMKTIPLKANEVCKRQNDLICLRCISLDASNKPEKEPLSGYETGFCSPLALMILLTI